ncbi:MAG: hypothetical protein IPP27_15715 [Bacteroidetes bacterium]|nr:hypothetical protein [Bacteroidota bacterium]
METTGSMEVLTTYVYGTWLRTPSEIEQDQTLHVVGSQQGLIGNWDFDDISNETTTNSVDNSIAYLMEGPSAIEKIPILIYGVMEKQHDQLHRHLPAHILLLLPMQMVVLLEFLQWN